MKPLCGNPANHRNSNSPQQHGSARVVLLGLICLACAAGAFWYFQSNKRRVENVGEPEKRLPELSDSTKSVLNRLESPVEIRFYSSLDPASVPESVRNFSARVDDLLAAYERDGNGKITVARHTSGDDVKAAAQDGVEIFNREKGDACYLGITVSCSGGRESFARLAPEWEPALEFDLSRAIARIAAAKPVAAPNLVAPPVSATTVQDLKQTLPNLDSLSVDQARQKLRDSALEEFKKVAAEMDAQVKQAQQQLAEAQNGQLETEQQAAMKNLQQIQTQSAEKLKEITLRLQQQLAALEKAKSGSQ